jgi:hypothetical protein
MAMTDNQSTPRLWEEVPVSEPPKEEGYYVTWNDKYSSGKIDRYWDGECWKKAKFADRRTHPDNVTHWLRPVPGNLIEYWKHRCKLAEKVIEASPCDPDITSQQIKAHDEYKKFLAGSPIPDNDIRTDSVAQLKQVPGIAITEEGLREVIGEAFKSGEAFTVCDMAKRLGMGEADPFPPDQTTYVQNKIDELFK